MKINFVLGFHNRYLNIYSIRFKFILVKWKVIEKKKK